MGMQTVSPDVKAQRWRGWAILLLCLVIGFGVFLAGTNLWAWYNYQAAKKAIEVGAYQQAEDYLERCLRFWSGNGQVHFWMARTARSLGKFDKAKQHLLKCEDLGWSPEGIDLEETLLRAEQGEFPQLEKTLLEWAEKDTEDTASVLQVLAKLYATNSQLGAASYWGERFLKHSPNNVTALLAMAQIQLMTRNSADALKYYRRAVEIQPDNDQARETLAKALLDLNEPQKALVEFRTLQGRGLHTQAVLLGLAQCYRALGQRDEAQEMLDRLVEQFPKSWQVWSERGRLAYQKRDMREAEECYRRSVDLHPYEHTTVYNLYLCLSQQGPAKRAEADKMAVRHKKLQEDGKRLNDLVVRGMSEHPNSTAITFEIAEILLRTGEEKGGVYWLHKTLQLNPHHSAARKALAAYYEKEGKHDLAAQFR
jgi:tetratricopeptide (TPR) repeat protein